MMKLYDFQEAAKETALYNQQKEQISARFSQTARIPLEEELYRNSNFVHHRNSKILYYDCTNYYFEIEENFRIMKSDLEARLVYVQKDDRIKAHFLTCYISLLVYRLLKKKLGEVFTYNQILETLCGMNMTLLSKDSDYIPSYSRTKLTDALHSTFEFRTDFEFISKASMRGIISKTKKKNSTKAKI